MCRSEREGGKGGAKKNEKSVGVDQNDGNARNECYQGGGVLEEDLEKHSDESLCRRRLPICSAVDGPYEYQF